MARTSKTVIGKGAKEQSRTMMQASQSGTAAKQRATEGLANERSRGTQQKLQGASQIASGLQQSRAQDAREKSTDRSQDLQEAQAGFTRAPELEQRSQQLEAEMGRGTASGMSPEQSQNLQDQGGKPLEIGGSGATQPGEAGGLRQTDYGKRKEARQQMEADTQRKNAQTRRMQQVTAARKAELSGDKEAFNLVKGQMDNGLTQQTDLFSRIMNEKPHPNDFARLSQWANENGGLADMQDGGQLAEILKSGRMPVDPEGRKRLQGFMQSVIDKNSMQYVQTLGHVPESLDLGGTIGKMFQSGVEVFTGIMKRMGPAFQGYNGINSQAEKLKAQNKFAAYLVNEGKVSPLEDSGRPIPQPDTSMPPSGGGALPPVRDPSMYDDTTSNDPADPGADLNYTEEAFQKEDDYQSRKKAFDQGR